MDNLSREGILELSESNPVGLIYSPTELHQYLVELVANHKTDYLHKGADMASFATLDDAMREAKKYGAKCFSCALTIRMTNVVRNACKTILTTCRFILISLDYFGKSL